MLFTHAFGMHVVLQFAEGSLVCGTAAWGCVCTCACLRLPTSHVFPGVQACMKHACTAPMPEEAP